MITEIRILSRFAVQDIIKTKGSKFPYKEQRWNLISINDDPDDLIVNESSAPILKNLGCIDTLSLCFADITAKHYEKILFNENHAKAIVEFIKQIQDERDESVLIAHCHAGISRSGAVGTFVCDYARLDYQGFIDLNPYIMSNPHVLSLLRRGADMTPSFGIHDGVDWAKEGDLLLPPWFKNTKLDVKSSGDAANE